MTERDWDGAGGAPETDELTDGRRAKPDEEARDAADAQAAATPERYEPADEASGSYEAYELERIRTYGAPAAFESAAGRDEEPEEEAQAPLVSEEALDDAGMTAMIEEICNSKAEEFHMLGYDSVTGKDVWDCVSSKYKELPPLHRIVNDILSLRATGLMNWMTLSVWKQSEKDPKGF